MEANVASVIGFALGAFEPASLTRLFAYGAAAQLGAKTLAPGRARLRDEWRAASGAPGG